MSKITNDGTGPFIAVPIAYGNSGHQRVNVHHIVSYTQSGEVFRPEWV